jgi:hypothetical protein
LEQAAHVLASVAYVACSLALVAGSSLLTLSKTADGNLAGLGVMLAAGVGIVGTRVQAGVVLALVDVARSLRALRNRR